MKGRTTVVVLFFFVLRLVLLYRNVYNKNCEGDDIIDWRLGWFDWLEI